MTIRCMVQLKHAQPGVARVHPHVGSSHMWYCQHLHRQMAHRSLANTKSSDKQIVDSLVNIVEWVLHFESELIVWS